MKFVNLCGVHKCLIAILIFQLSLPSKIWAAPPASESATPETYSPYLVIDGIFLPDDELPHLPAYRTYFARGFTSQPQVRLVDYTGVAQWKKKFAIKTQPRTPAEDYLAKARETLAEGKTAYQMLDFNQAMEKLTTARNEFILNLSHLRSNRDLLEAHLYLGMTYIALTHAGKVDHSKFQKQAEIEFEKVVTLDPQRELTAASFPPDVVQLFEKVKQRLTAGNRITVRIDANVSQSKVYLNGKLLGQPPIKTRLIPGEYYVLVEKQGMKPWSQLVTLKNTVENINASLESAAENADWNSGFQVREGADQQSANMDELEGLAKAVGGETIFLSNLDQADDRLRILGQLYDVRTREFSQVAIVDIGQVSSDHSQPIEGFESAAYDMAKAMAAMIRPDGYLVNSGQSLMGMDPSRVVPALPQSIEQHEAPKAKLYEHWWFWAGVAAIGVGAYFGISALGGTSGETIVIDNKGNF